MQYKAYTSPGEVRVVIDTAQDVSSLLDLEDHLLSIIDEHSGEEFILDLVHMKHINSATIGVIATLIQKLEGNGKKLNLANVSELVTETLDFTELLDLVNIQKSS